MPGVASGSRLDQVVSRTGPLTIGHHPEIGVETPDAAGLRQNCAACEDRGCTVNPRLGSGQRVGRYEQGGTDNGRDTAGVHITGVELEFP